MAQMLHPIEEFDILVKRIRSESGDSSRVVFEASVLTWRPIKREWQETKQRIVCTGYFFNLVEDDHLHVKAEEMEHPIYGPQWQIYTYERVQPGSEAEMLRFLTSIKGVGPAIGKKLLDEFGLNVISMITEDASCLNRISLPQTAKDNLYKAIVQNQSYERLLVFLQLHNLPPKHATNIYKMYGDTAIEKICDNPYALYLDDVIDYPAAIRLDYSIGQCSMPAYRIQAGVLACFRDDSENNGNLFIDRDQLSQKAREYVAKASQGLSLPVPTEQEIDDAVAHLVSNQFLFIDNGLKSGKPIYLTQNYYAEKRIADRLCYLMDSIKDLRADIQDIKKVAEARQAKAGIKLNVEQESAIISALSSPVSILTGGPGTGKTQTLTLLVQTAKALWPDIDIRICAPTGKAAVRAKDLTGIPASTIHRMIGYPHNMLGEDELLCNLLIADEYSMCDAQLCAWLFRAVWSGARILIVGDHEQLPSVGPGLVLRDLIDCGLIPVTKLTTVYRQSGNSHITMNAHNIIATRAGREVSMEWSTEPKGDFYMVGANSQRSIQRRILQCVDRLKAEGFPLDQIAVLSPVHNGLAGVDALKLILQEHLNPSTHGYQLTKGIDIRIGDKVIQTRNNYDLSVFNGETGFVCAIDYMPTRAVCVDYSGRSVWYDAQQAEDLELAYAITTHRSQGSEYQVVIIPICESLMYSSNKSILYTGVTRAKKRVIFVGSKEALAEALKKPGVMDRNSKLMFRIQSNILAS